MNPKVVQNVFYALPLIAVNSLFVPILVVQGVYAKYYGFALTTIAGVIVFARLFDAITDPIIGYLSDRWRIKTGTRKPAMTLGAIVLVSSSYFLYSPPDGVSTFYFACWFIVFYLGYTLFNIPHLAWGGEISPGTYEKTQTYTLRIVAAYFGAILFYSLPLLPFWVTTEITPQILQFSAFLSALIMLPLLYSCMKKVPDGLRYSEKSLGIENSRQVTVSHFRELTKTVEIIICNRPLLLFLGAFLFAGSGLGMWIGLFFIFVDSYLGMGAWFAKISLIGLVLSIPGALVWLEVAKYLGKKCAWLLAMLLAIAAFSYTGYLGPETVDYWSLLLVWTTIMLCFVCVESLPQSMLSDIVDYSTWKYSSYLGSTYFSLFVFTYKGAGALGGALGLALAGWYGFDPSLAVQTESGIVGLKLAMTLVPTLMALISLGFISASPITARRHGTIQRRLETIEARQKTADGKKLDKSATETLVVAH